MKQPVCLVTTDKYPKVEELNTDIKGQFGGHSVPLIQGQTTSECFKVFFILFIQSKQDSFLSWRIMNILSFDIV